jgi:hypothetical protein
MKQNVLPLLYEQRYFPLCLSRPPLIKERKTASNCLTDPHSKIFSCQGTRVTLLEMECFRTHFQPSYSPKAERRAEALPSSDRLTTTKNIVVSDYRSTVLPFVIIQI